MSLCLEYKKVKRTGFFPAFVGGGILAAAVPVLNMAVRSEIYIGQPKPPVQILLAANWQMMAMLNILLVVAGACLMYHMEYSDNAIQKMRTLPIWESHLFFGKCFLMVAACVLALAVEAASVAFCAVNWFAKVDGLGTEILKNFSYSFLLMLPVIFLSLFIASQCQNMWVSLGIGVICVFLATMIPMKQFALSLFPFALPYQMIAGRGESTIRKFAIGAVAEVVGLAIVQPMFLKVRRLFE